MEIGQQTVPIGIGSQFFGQQRIVTPGVNNAPSERLVKAHSISRGMDDQSLDPMPSCDFVETRHECPSEPAPLEFRLDRDRSNACRRVVH